MKFLGHIEIRYRFSQHLGPRFQHGDVTLVFCTADTYRFLSKAEWPEYDWTSAVERGARDGLIEAGYDLEQGVEITLRRVEVHNVDSSEKAFYFAARCAAKSCAEIKWT